jgi:hypothetical protein
VSNKNASQAAVVDAVVLASRRADEEFHRVGGSFHQWVRDFLLPALNKEGYQIVPLEKKGEST